jgi:hypothetical protein
LPPAETKKRSVGSVSWELPQRNGGAGCPSVGCPSVGCPSVGCPSVGGPSVGCPSVRSVSWASRLFSHRGDRLGERRGDEEAPAPPLRGDDERREKADRLGETPHRLGETAAAAATSSTACALLGSSVQPPPTRTARCGELPPRLLPIDAACTPCLRHGDPMRAKKRLTTPVGLDHRAHSPAKLVGRHRLPAGV